MAAFFPGNHVLANRDGSHTGYSQKSSRDRTNTFSPATRGSQIMSARAERHILPKDVSELRSRAATTPHFSGVIFGENNRLIGRMVYLPGNLFDIGEEDGPSGGKSPANALSLGALYREQHPVHTMSCLSQHREVHTWTLYRVMPVIPGFPRRQGPGHSWCSPRLHRPSFSLRIGRAPSTSSPETGRVQIYRYFPPNLIFSLRPGRT